VKEKTEARVGAKEGSHVTRNLRRERNKRGADTQEEVALSVRIDQKRVDSVGGKRGAQVNISKIEGVG